MKKGWICLRCGKVNAPFIEQCSCNNTDYYYHSNGLCDHVWRIQSLNPDKNGRIALDVINVVKQFGAWKTLILIFDKTF